MVTFAYRASDTRGELRAGIVQGASRDHAKAALRRQGLYAVELQERGSASGAPAGVESLLDRLRSPRAELPDFTRSMATFLAAGFPVDRALGMCTDLAAHAQLGAALRRIRRELQGGRSLAAALATEPQLFPPLYVSTVAAAERAGALEAGLASLATHLEERRELASQIRSLLVYPALMALVGGAAVTVLLIFVIPRFVSILEGGGAELPWATALLVGVSRFLARFGWLVALALAAAGALIHARLKTTAARLRWDRAKLRAPLVGAFVRKLLAARFCRSLGTLLANGVPLPQALRLAAETLGNAAAAEAVREAQSRVKEGQSLAGALEPHAVFPTPALRMTAVGEETGRLEEMLSRAADLYESEVRRDLRSLVSLVEPAMVLAMGAVVGFVALAMIQAIFSINEVPL